jgi:hypothetical protein
LLEDDAVAKSILAIDVQDAAFQNFLKTFNQYQTALKHMPGAWRQINQAVKGNLAGFQQLVNAAVAHNVQTKLILQAQEKADRITATTADRWKGMAISARTFASHITDATRSILRWSAVGGLLSGLLGITSLWGLDRLGAAAGAGRRGALGLGMTYGQRQAFSLAFGRLVDTESFTGGVSGASADVTKRRALYTAGLSEQDIAGKNTAEVSAMLVNRLKRLADQTPEAMLGTIAERYGFGQFGIGGEEMRRLRSTKGAELADLQRYYAGRMGGLNVDDRTLRAWQDFTMKIDTAGREIETQLIRKLVALAPGLGSLSESVVNVIKNLSGTEGINEWLRKLGKGIEDFATYIGTPEFQQNVRIFVDSVGQLASKTVSALRFLGLIPSGEAAAPTGFPAPGDIVRSPTGFPAPGGNNLLALVRNLEGSGVNAVSPKGAIGNYQIMPETGRLHGVSREALFDPATNKAVAETELNDLRRQYQTLAEVLVAYNASTAVRQRFVASGDNPAVLPLETQKYLERAAQMGANLRANVHITLENKTGSSAVFATKQAGIAWSPGVGQ